MGLNHLFVESVVFPLALTLALTPLLRRVLGARGELLSAAAIGIALLVVYALIFGLPAWPAHTGTQKLPLIFLLALGGGMVLDISQPGRLAVAIASAAAIVGTALWLGWPQLKSDDSGVVLLLALTSLLALVCLAGVQRANEAGANRPAMIVLAALGLAGASLNAGSLALFQIALALAAAVGGFALWNWPQPRLPFAGSGMVVGALGCFAVALLLLLLTKIRPWMLLPLVLVFVSDAVSRRLPVPLRFRRTAIEPLFIVAIGSIPAVAVILLAGMSSSSDVLYYR